MSRYDLQPLKEFPAILSVTIGWDRPLQTFFIQIFEQQPEDPEPVLIIWEGTDYHALPDAEKVIDLAAKYAIIPEDLADKLALDQDKSRSIKDSALQEIIRGIFRSL